MTSRAQLKIEENIVPFGIEKIKKVLPHRYPFLLIDKVVEFSENERIVGLKAVSANEQFFQGHFPQYMIMPGVLIMEAMAQLGGILANLSSDGVGEGKIIMLVGADNFRWKRPVVPGDLLRIEMESIKKRRPIWRMRGSVFVDDQLVVSGEITAAESDG
jgi:3-hydroxyacyl-[acyl-carrier-protein] dehydratase